MCATCLGTGIQFSNSFVYRLLNQLTLGMECEMPSSKDQTALKLKYSRKNSKEKKTACTSMCIPRRYVCSEQKKSTAQPDNLTKSMK
jgi:hypothetical protein